MAFGLTCVLGTMSLRLRDSAEYPDANAKKIPLESMENLFNFTEFNIIIVIDLVVERVPDFHNIFPNVLKIRFLFFSEKKIRL